MVSIIITVYKKQLTIKRCLESVLHQTYKDIEVVIINDDLGETISGCNELLNQLEKKFKVINYTNPQNVGAGLSRRKGVELSTGEYTTFLDSDDYIKNNYIETLVKYANKTNAELVTSGVIVIDGNNRKIKTDVYGVYTDKKSKFRIDKNDSLRFLNTCLVSKKLWNQVTYSKERFIEDTPVLFKLIYLCNKRAIIPYAGYYYVQQNDSLCHASDNIKKHVYILLSNIDVYNFLISQNDFKIANKMLESFYDRYVNLFHNNISMINNIYKEQMITINKFYINNFTKYEKQNKYN